MSTASPELVVRPHIVLATHLPYPLYGMRTAQGQGQRSDSSPATPANGRQVILVSSRGCEHMTAEDAEDEVRRVKMILILDEDRVDDK
jgi:hypothetical protein